VTTNEDDFGPICKLAETRKGEGKHFRPTGGRWRNKAMAVFEENGEYFVTNFICPHQGGPISEGKLVDGIVECPWHGWKFDVKTGLSADKEDGHSIEIYDIKVEGDTIMVGGIKRPGK
jgi:sulfoxide reductase heme-binding subunit YedZ